MSPATSSVKPRRSPIVWLVLVAVLLAGGAWWFSHRGGTAEAKVAEAAKVDSKTPTGPFELAADDVALVQRHALAKKLPLSGTLSPLVQATVKSKVAGEILEITVREGQSVHKHDVLARIDTRSQQAMVASQRAALEKARADMALARLNMESNQTLLNKHFIAQIVLDTSKSVYAANAASVKLAEAQMQMAEIGLADAVVRAPMDGIVSRRNVQPGEKVSPDSPLLSLVDLAQLELQAAAPAGEVPFVKIGQLARVHVDGFGDADFLARVERINPSAEQGSRSILLYLSVANPESRLKGGMFAQGELVIAQTEPVLAIPAAAVRTEEGANYVTVVEKNALLRKPVKLGLASDSQALVEVREGLAEGEQVLVGKLDTLKPGTRVVIRAAASSATASNK